MLYLIGTYEMMTQAIDDSDAVDAWRKKDAEDFIVDAVTANLPVGHVVSSEERAHIIKHFTAASAAAHALAVKHFTGMIDALRLKSLYDPRWPMDDDVPLGAKPNKRRYRRRPHRRGNAHGGQSG